jgi:vacuolar iron transporter family protein
MKSHFENHQLNRIAWLRAAVLGANDGIISTASIVIGVAATQASSKIIMVTALASLVSGAMAMATGEYISVAAQADSEKAAIAQEKNEINADFETEVQELAAIYVKRGLAPELAHEVAVQLMKKDALGAHVRDELHLSSLSLTNPFQAALSSALSFALGALLPLIVALFSPLDQLVPFIGFTVVIALALLGTIAARLGNAGVLLSVTRVLLWSSLAMAATYFVGKLVNWNA